MQHFFPPAGFSYYWVIFLKYKSDHITLLLIFFRIWKDPVCFFFFLGRFYLFILFLAVLGLCCCLGFFPLVVASGGPLSSCGGRASHCSGFTCFEAWALTCAAWVAAARGLSGCSSQALEQRASLLLGMWDPPWPGIEPVSPALAGRFFTTELPGKPDHVTLLLKISNIKEIKTNKWKDFPHSWIISLNIIRIAILSKLIYRFTAISLKIKVAPPFFFFFLQILTSWS